MAWRIVGLILLGIIAVAICVTVFPLGYTMLVAAAVFAAVFWLAYRMIHKAQQGDRRYDAPGKGYDTTGGSGGFSD